MSDSEENKGKLYWGVLPECIYNKFFLVKISYRDAKLAEYWSYIELQVLASAFLLRKSPAEALHYLDMVCELKNSPAVIAENRNILSKDFSGKVKIQLVDSGKVHAIVSPEFNSKTRQCILSKLYMDYRFRFFDPSLQLSRPAP